MSEFKVGDKVLSFSIKVEAVRHDVLDFYDLDHVKVTLDGHATYLPVKNLSLTIEELNEKVISKLDLLKDTAPESLKQWEREGFPLIR